MNFPTSNNSTVLASKSTPFTEVQKEQGKVIREDQIKEDLRNRCLEIGIQDPRLIFIAEQSLSAPLPPNWVQCTTEDGYIYYYNDNTDESCWEHPSLHFYKQLYIQKLQELQRLDQLKYVESGRQHFLEDMAPTSSSVIKPNATDSLLPSSSPSKIEAWTQNKTNEKMAGEGTLGVTSEEKVERKMTRENNTTIAIPPESHFTSIDNWKSKFDELALEKKKSDEHGSKLAHTAEIVAQKLRQCEVQVTSCLRNIVDNCGEDIIQISQVRSTPNDLYDLDIVKASSSLIQQVQLLIEQKTIASRTWKGTQIAVRKELELYCPDTSILDDDELISRLEFLLHVCDSYSVCLSQKKYNALFRRFVKKNSTGTTMEDTDEKIHGIAHELEETKKSLAEAQIGLEKTIHENELLRVKLEGAQQRIDDAHSREEAMFNKLSAVMMNMNDSLKSGIKTGVSGIASIEGSVNGSNADMATLQMKIISLNEELLISSKRAADAEKRMEAILMKNTEEQSSIKELEEKYRSRLEKKRLRCLDLERKNAEADKVTKEMFIELQDALRISQKLDEECQLLRSQLVGNVKGGVEIDAIKFSLEDEVARSKSLEKRIISLEASLQDMRDRAKKSDDLAMELGEQLQIAQERLNSKMGDCETYRLRCDRLADENSALERQIRHIKLQLLSLNDKIADLQGNIRVFCRVRPILTSEMPHIGDAEIRSYVQFPDINKIALNHQIFEFDRVFDSESQQTDVFEEINPAVKSVMNGHKVCILAYGQTGSGKTFTMIGDSSNNGMNIRALETIFAIADEDNIITTCNMSMLEVYNEKISDLLNISSKDLELRVGKKGQGVYVEDLSEFQVKSIEDVRALMSRGNNNRTVSSNNINEHSSRSHLVIMIRVERENMRTGNVTIGHLYLVDLAGSERIKMTNASGQRLREAQNINKSLSSLGDVINALGSNQKHIPYRNSKLTFLLSDVLSSNARVIMFVNITPIPESFSESSCSLTFATRCRTVALGASKAEASIVSSSNGLAISSPSTGGKNKRDFF